MIMIGSSLLVHGLLKAPIKNETEIFKKYACNRATLDARSTDVYCYDTKTAPEAKKNYITSFTKSGSALLLLGITYAVVIIIKRK